MESGGSGGSSSKKGKKVEQQSKKRQKTNTIDYMNYIPEAIVFHILSLLPLGELIIMSLVSQRWKDTVVRYLKIVPSSLNLDECEMPGTILKRDGQCLLRSNFAHSGYSLKQRHCLIRAARKSFIEFVDRCLQLHSDCMINNLRLTFLHEAGGDYEYTRKIDMWVHFAFTKDIKELSLDFSDLTLSKPLAQPFELPHGYFAPKITKTFSLKFCKFRLSTFQVFGSLKGISLVQVEILDGSLAELASKCPVLKDVNLVNCVFPDQFMMSEEDIIVEKLSVIDCKTEEWEACNINLSTPCLLKLHIVGNILMTSHIRNATKLLDVTFCMEEINENYLQGDALGSFFIELGHSRSLTVNNCCIQVLPAGNDLLQGLPTYLNNLNHLCLLAGLEKQEMPGISCLLRSSPNLENLTLLLLGTGRENFQNDAPPFFDLEERIYWDERNSTFSCVQNSLKKVTMDGFSGRNNEMKLIQFLLKKARVLRKMEIISISTAEVMEKIQYLSETLSYFPRASPLASIEFC